MSKNSNQTEETKNKILDSAIDIFYEKGVTRATLEEIAIKRELRVVQFIGILKIKKIFSKL